MKTNRRASSYLSPFMLWSDLAMKTGEMMLASTQVIGHRTRRIAMAGRAPNARDRREFALMGQEKVEASAQSARAMTAHLMTMNQRLGARALQNMLHGTASLISLANSRTPAQLIARQAAFARAMGQTAMSMAEATNSATKLAHRGLKPVHAKATANAKRLAKR